MREFIAPLKDFIPNVMSAINDMVVGLTSSDELGVRVGSAKPLVAQITKASSKHRFSEFINDTLPIPIDLKTELVPYLAFLEGRLPAIQKLIFPLCEEFYFVLAALTNSKDGQTDIADITDFTTRTAAAREEFTAALKAFFTKEAVGRDRARTDAVIGRFNDIQHAYDLIVKLDRYRDEKLPTKIQGEVKRITGLLSIIHKNIERGDITKVSEEVARTVAIGCRELGLMVELVVVYTYHVENAIRAGLDMIDIMEKRTK